MSAQVALAVGVLLLSGNAFFVGAEFATLSARRSAIEPLAEQGDRRAQTVVWAMEHLSLMLACAQLGVTVCSTGLGIIAEPAIARTLQAPLHALGLPAGLLHPVAFVVALVIVVYLHVVLGEMVPKSLAVTSPDRAVMIFTPPLVMLGRVLRPVIVSLNWLANHVVRLLGITPQDEVASAFTAQEVQSIVVRSQAEGMLADEEGLLTGALEFSERTAEQVMVPVAALVSLPQGCTPEDLEGEVRRTGFSRFPVVGASPDDLVGYLHLKDVLDATAESASRPIDPRRVRALADVSPDTEVEETLATMQRSGAHLARVRDTGSVLGGGAVLGVVFLEDILEELVGEVRDAMQRGDR